MCAANAKSRRAWAREAREAHPELGVTDLEKAPRLGILFSKSWLRKMHKEQCYEYRILGPANRGCTSNNS
jgi:hypothetical protein